MPIPQRTAERRHHLLWQMIVLVHYIAVKSGPQWKIQIGIENAYWAKRSANTDLCLAKNEIASFTCPGNRPIHIQIQPKKIA